MNGSDEIPPEDLKALAELYLATEISIEEHGDLVPASHFSGLVDGVLHILTAWNPGTARPGQKANEAADQALYRDLVAIGLTPIRAVGTDPQSTHHEESWAVNGLTDHQAKTRGARYGQVAIFRLEGSHQHVLFCSASWSLTRML